MKSLILSLAFMAAPIMSLADAGSVTWPEGTDVVILGEVHDNPAHHLVQAEAVARLAPKAVVFEMLSEEQAAKVTPDLLGDEAALGAALDWSNSGWPEFSMYYPVFAALGEARIYGAHVPRGKARAATQEGAAAVFGPEAERFGLDRPLPPEQQEAREAMQQVAHCNAMPEEMLPMMVEMQRLRDAALARAVADAFAETGGPVAVITGNGHARRDWGLLGYLLESSPSLRVFALGQIEDGQEAPASGQFDQVISAPPVVRPDPCAGFRKG